MDWIKVDSSNVAAIKRDGGDMLVKFNKGAVYRYRDVPPAVTTAMAQSASVGKFFHSDIKNKYDYIIEPDQ
jgi:hypothetical protein